MIEFSDVRFSYKGKSDVSLNVAELSIGKGECVLLTGVSGSGKSTITKCINGLVPEFFEGDFSGAVYVDGKNLESIPVCEIAKFTASVFQDPASQFFTDDALSELAFACENYGIEKTEIKRRIESAVETVGVQNLLGKKLSKMSNGEKQKIAIASVLAMTPTLVLFDEPSSNLDYASILLLRGIIRRLKNKGFTLIVAEHRIYYLRDLFDRVLYVQDGLVAKEYSAREFCALPNEALHAMGLRSLDVFSNEPCRPDTRAGEAALYFENITYSYKNKSVLKNVGARLHRGEVAALVGKNGIGKTTLARVLAGIYEQDAGTIRIDGKEMSAAKRVRAINFVMNDVDYQLFSDSVHNELLLGNAHIDDVEHKISEVLSRLNLYDLRDEHPMSLSMGQKQRLVIAASYIRNSPVTIFDEPTSGLDYRNMLGVSALIGELASTRNAVLIVSHDYEFICDTCDRLLLLTERGIEQDIRLCGNSAQLKEIFSTHIGGISS